MGAKSEALAKQFEVKARDGRSLDGFSLDRIDEMNAVAEIRRVFKMVAASSPVGRAVAATAAGWMPC